MKYIIALLIITIPFFGNAQVKKTVHQTFELSDENADVTLDIFDEYEVEKWSSNNIMIVTTVTLESGIQHVLDYYVRVGRYDVEKSGEETSLVLTSKDKVRKGMKYKETMIYEIVKMKLFIPDNYELNGKDRLVKKVEETASTSNQ
ncbi:MAG: hypothetical protein AB8F94_11625 [Saprospiraceae bacterium]